MSDDNWVVAIIAHVILKVERNNFPYFLNLSIKSCILFLHLAFPLILKTSNITRDI